MTDQAPHAQRMKALGATLKAARESAGKSLRGTARLMGISGPTLSAYEEGRKAISLPELELFAYHLNIPVQRFLGDSATIFYPPRRDFDPKRMLALRNRTIGAMIRAQRLDRGMSLRGLSKLTGWPAGRISSYERGERRIPLPALETLAALFGQPIEEYLATSGPIADLDDFYQSLDTVMEIPQKLRVFLKDSENERFVRLAMRLSELPTETLRTLAEGLLDLTI